MACRLKAELSGRDGRRSVFTVEAENNLKSIIEGVKKINKDISVVLTELVEEERSSHGGGGERPAHEEEDDEDEEDEDEDDEEEGDEEKDAATEPVEKRRKRDAPSEH